MRNVEERRVGTLTVQIDRTLCVGFGDCITVAPDVFDLDDEGIAVFRSGLEAVARAHLLEACDACPVDALSVHDSDGIQLVP